MVVSRSKVHLICILRRLLSHCNKIREFLINKLFLLVVTLSTLNIVLIQGCYDTLCCPFYDWCDNEGYWKREEKNIARIILVNPELIANIYLTCDKTAHPSLQPLSVCLSLQPSPSPKPKITHEGGSKQPKQFQHVLGDYLMNHKKCHKHDPFPLDGHLNLLDFQVLLFHLTSTNTRFVDKLTFLPV